jgi:hypothetical protein
MPMISSQALRQNALEMADALARWERDGGAQAPQAPHVRDVPDLRQSEERVLRTFAALQGLDLEHSRDAGARPFYRLTEHGHPGISAPERRHGRADFKLAYEDVATILMNGNVA